MWLDRFNELRKASGLSLDELSEKSGVPKGTLAKITSGITKAPALETMRSLVYAMGYKLDDLDDAPSAQSGFTPAEKDLIKKYRALDKHGKEMVLLTLDCEARRMASIEENTETERLVYIYHSDQKASAGTGFKLDYEQMERWAVEYNDLTRKADFCVTVAGDSMEPKFFDGDIILVQTTQSVDIGEIGLFVMDGDGFVKKRGQGRLISLNSEYPDILPGRLNRLDCMGRVLGVLKPEWIVER